jgi:hypothetical protein
MAGWKYYNKGRLKFANVASKFKIPVYGCFFVFYHFIQNPMIHWKKKFFSTCTNIYSGERIIGKLSENSWKQTADGECYNKRYRFKTSGIFKQKTTVYELNGNREIGKITYNSMMSKAEIHYPDQIYHWKYDNLWQTRWSLTDDSGNKMEFHGRTHTGFIRLENEDALLILTGLFITNYYQQMLVVIMAAIFIPILASTTS